MNDLGTLQHPDAGPRSFTKIKYTKLESLAAIVLGDGISPRSPRPLRSMLSTSQPDRMASPRGTNRIRPTTTSDCFPTRP